MYKKNVWMRFALKKAACLVAGLAVFGLADNPISSYHYLADPSAAADDDTFYILTDVDDYNNQTNYNYDIVGLYAFTSKDMKNWTDHGMVFRSKREFGNYPNNTWASGIAVHKGRIYIVYPNGANGVGMLTATSIDGPYTDPVRETHGVNYIASNNGDPSVIGGCDGIAHCFDPGIFIEKDGTGYVVFGGGTESSNRGLGNNLDIIKFTESNGKITIDKNSLTRIDAKGSFEAPYIHKKDNKYYLSFNTAPQVIDYGMSDKITGPYSFVGTVIPGIASVPDAHNQGGNNHQGFAEFKGKWYAVYHDRRLVTSDAHPASCTQAGVCSAQPNYENHRSVAIDELTWSGDKMNTLKFTNEGPAQIDNFDPYQSYKALTSSKQKNVRSRTDWTKNEPVVHVLTPLASKESWIRVSGVDFGKGAQKFIITGASVADGNKVEVHAGSASGTLAGTCDIKNTGSWNKYEDNECEVTGLSGIVDELFIVFKGSKDSTMGLTYWEFVGEGGKTPDTPQSAFGGTAWAVPGKIEVENFDVPGVGRSSELKSYYDADSENHSCTDEEKVAECSDYRDGTPVDIYKLADGKIVVGHNQEGEWLEYSINVAEAGDYTMFASAATGNANGASFSLSIDGESLVDVSVPKTSWEDFDYVSKNVTLPAGEHILKMTITSSWFDIDYLAFAKGKDASIEDLVDALPQNVKLEVNALVTFNVFDLNGKKIASFKARNMAEAAKLWRDGSVKGSEKASGMNLIRNTANGMISKVRIAR